MQFVAAKITGQSINVAYNNLAHQELLGRVLPGHAAPTAQDVVHAIGVKERNRTPDVGPVQVVGRKAHVAVIVVLADRRHGVESETVNASIKPEPQNFVEVFQYLFVLPIEVRLTGVEEIEIPLTGRAVRVLGPSPRRPSEDALPVVRRFVSTFTSTIFEIEPLPLFRTFGRGQRRLEPRVLAGTVIRDQIENDSQTKFVTRVNKVLDVLECAKEGIDVKKIFHVVAAVTHR